jgi:hypothetical protein
MFEKDSACFQLLHEHALHKAEAKSQEASEARVGCMCVGTSPKCEPEKFVRCMGVCEVDGRNGR